MKKYVFFMIFIFILNSCFADVFVMKNGTVYEGKVIKENMTTITIINENRKRNVLDINQIQSQKDDYGTVLLSAAIEQNSTTATEQTNTTLMTDVNSPVPTDDELKMAQIQYYSNIGALRKSTEGIQEILGIELTIIIVGIVGTIAIYAISAISANSK